MNSVHKGILRGAAACAFAVVSVMAIPVLAADVPSATKKAPMSTDGSDPKTWDMKKDGVLLAPGNHKVLYEDDEVRVLMVTVAPGTAEPYHLHPYPSVLVNVATRPTQLINRDASGKEAKNWASIDLLESPVLIIVDPPVATHSIKNVGTTPGLSVRVEFKRGTIPTLIHPNWPNGTLPISTDGTDPKTWDPKLDALVAARQNHKLVFEDDNVRVVSVSLPPGAKEPFHHHVNPAVMIVYGDAPIKGADTDSTGKVTLQSIGGQGGEAQVFLLPPNGLHSSANPGTNPVHIIRIDFKKGFPTL